VGLPLLFLWLASIGVNRCRDDKFLYRIDDLFTLQLVVVGFTDKRGSRADVFENVTVVSEFVAVNEEVSNVSGTFKGFDAVTAGFFGGIVAAGVKDLSVIGNQIEAKLLFAFPIDIPFAHLGCLRLGFFNGFPVNVVGGTLTASCRFEERDRFAIGNKAENFCVVCKVFHRLHTLDTLLTGRVIFTVVFACQNEAITVVFIAFCGEKTRKFIILTKGELL